MQFPYIVEPDAPEDQAEQRFGVSNDWDRSIRETVWRRHQSIENRELSGWNSEYDCRRRLIHFRDRYGMVGHNFCLLETYLYINLKAPEKEILSYKAQLDELISQGGWIGNRLEDLSLETVLYDKHPQDELAGRFTPDGYLSLDITISNVDLDIKNKPWEILKTGIRKTYPAGKPVILEHGDLQHLLPAQVELGCGPSIEAGIPPLNHFHKLFSIHQNGTFVFSLGENDFLDVFKNTHKWYEKSVHMHRQGLLASPTKFYHQLKRLHDLEYIVGPILNNNFDGLPLSVGLSEFPLRKFDAEGIYPAMHFHPDAKSLFVIGSHADRRKCQQHARAKGLTIVYIDPEGYDIDGKWTPYPVESPQTGDCLLRTSANQAFIELDRGCLRL